MREPQLRKRERHYGKEAPFRTSGEERQKDARERIEKGRQSLYLKNGKRRGRNGAGTGSEEGLGEGYKAICCGY